MSPNSMSSSFRGNLQAQKKIKHCSELKSTVNCSGYIKWCCSNTSLNNYKMQDWHRADNRKKQWRLCVLVGKARIIRIHLKKQGVHQNAILLFLSLITLLPYEAASTPPHNESCCKQLYIRRFTGYGHTSSCSVRYKRTNLLYNQCAWTLHRNVEH